MRAAFQQFQQDFARHLRDPAHVARPPGVPARGAALYGELVFANLGGVLDACFPVGRAMFGEARWRRLQRAFLRDWPLPTPWFREIPREFVAWLGADCRHPPLPRWFAELAHYEWAELAVDTHPASPPPAVPVDDPMTARLARAPALLNLTYAWPVHRIGPDWRPRRPETVCLAVYRDAAEAVRFCQLSPASHQLLEIFAAAPLTGDQALARLAALPPGGDPLTWREPVRRLCRELLALGMLYGSP